MPAFFAPSRTASAYASASATRALRRAISRTRREARARSRARPRSPAASVCSARSNKLRANDGSAESRLEGTRSLRAAAIARFVTSSAARGVRPRSHRRRYRPRQGGPRRCLGLAGRRGRSLVGMAVVDGEGVEVGYVSGEEVNTLVLGEGSGGRMRLGRRFVSGIVDRVTLRGPAAEIFAGLNVIDSDGEFVGIVRDTNEADDVLDSFIVEDESGEMVNVLLEDVRSIDEWGELSVAGDSLYEKG